MVLAPLPMSAKSTAVHAIVIQLSAAAKGQLPATLGRAIHAQVMDWLSLGDSALARRIHDNQESPMSLSGLIGHRRKQGIRPDDHFYFRVAFLQGDLIDPLLDGLEKWGTRPITLAHFPFVIRSVDSLPGTHPQVGSSDYSLLAKTPQASGDITLNFRSPTSFKQHKGIQPFPLPELVFSNLQRRWNTFAPSDLQIPEIEWQALVSAFDLKTHAFKLEGGSEIGAQGWVRYRFLDQEQAAIASVLSHFAFFAGVGRKTSMGMGQTQLIR